ncbi:hypothetical protein [Cecembia rubra]|uniref:hypothetical protein n=1 Tax=Cecembia rubra TaxID=1485585 RepID=UPI002714DB98|nr:hypothetical protein [Cecembia rubra]
MNYLTSRNFLSVYFAFSIVNTFLFLIGIFGTMPMAIGLTGFVFCFAIGAVKNMLSGNNNKFIYAAVFWAISILLSIQVVFLFDPGFKLMLLYGTTFLLILSVFIVYRFEMDKRLYLLLFLISQISGLIYINF